MDLDCTKICLSKKEINKTTKFKFSISDDYCLIVPVSIRFHRLVPYFSNSLAITSFSKKDTTFTAVAFKLQTVDRALLDQYLRTF